eukprot:m.231662 g.231662  ORF g.231662 m.231662 type:complete len:434 (-) comp12249_c0_seq1:117-1418(-)
MSSTPCTTAQIKLHADHGQPQREHRQPEEDVSEPKAIRHKAILLRRCLLAVRLWPRRVLLARVLGGTAFHVERNDGVWRNGAVAQWAGQLALVHPLVYAWPAVEVPAWRYDGLLGGIEADGTFVWVVISPIILGSTRLRLPWPLLRAAIAAIRAHSRHTNPVARGHSPQIRTGTGYVEGPSRTPGARCPTHPPMQDPNADTEWNDILRAKGILPPKPKSEAEITEEQLIALAEEAAQRVIAKTETGEKDIEDLSLDELDELEDEETERIAQEYRARRIAEMKAQASKSKFGEIINITAKEYKQEVNNAGKGIWVVLFLYKTELMVCIRLQQHLKILAQKFPAVKFVQSIASSCIPNYPDRNLPSVFLYHEDDLKVQFIGPSIFGGESSTVEDVEWALAQAGVLQTELEEDPRVRRPTRSQEEEKAEDYDSDDD